MLGVDKLDQLTTYYSFLHKSVKWWRKVFFWALEVSVVNAYIIYRELVISRSERPMTHVAFRRVLIKSLSAPLRNSHSATKVCSSRTDSGTPPSSPSLPGEREETERLCCMQQQGGRNQTPNSVLLCHMH